MFSMNEELLQSYVRAPSAADEEEPSRLYPAKEKKEEKVKEKKVKEERRDSTAVPAWIRRKNLIVIEQRKVKTVPLAVDECYCDKDRAAAVSFGHMDIKFDLKAKESNEKTKTRIMPDDTDAMAFLMLGMREIKYNNLENGVRFLCKVFN
jgi:5-keto 4-deoxyuronate isomerase